MAVEPARLYIEGVLRVKRMRESGPELYATLQREHQREYETKNGAMRCQDFGQSCDVCALLERVEKGK